MDVGIVVLIAVAGWISLMVIVLALCRAAARADAESHGSYRALRGSETRSDRYYAALR